MHHDMAAASHRATQARIRAQRLGHNMPTLYMETNARSKKARTPFAKQALCLLERELFLAAAREHVRQFDISEDE